MTPLEEGCQGLVAGGSETRLPPPVPPPQPPSTAAIRKARGGKGKVVGSEVNPRSHDGLAKRHGRLDPRGVLCCDHFTAVVAAHPSLKIDSPPPPRCASGPGGGGDRKKMRIKNGGGSCRDFRPKLFHWIHSQIQNTPKEIPSSQRAQSSSLLGTRSAQKQ